MVGVMDSIIWHVPVRIEPALVLGKLLLIPATFLGLGEQKTEANRGGLFTAWFPSGRLLIHCNSDDVA